MHITFKHIATLFMSMTGCHNFQKKIEGDALIKRVCNCFIYILFIFIENMCYDWKFKV